MGVMTKACCSRSLLPRLCISYETTTTRQNEKTMADLWQLSAQDAVLQIRKGELTVVSYAASLLEHIRQRDSAVRAWVYLDEDHILRQARALDKVPQSERGPIHGLAVGIKDIMLTRDMPTQYNSRLYQTDTPIAIDAAPVAVLRAKGALIFGKLTTTEFATTPQGKWHQNHTANARDPTRTPGGSSSGSGAAVADYQIPIALGTQTGGSIIRPASFNGCYGWKPTWGLISREGVAQWCITLDTVGFFTRTVGDLALMADAFAIEDAYTEPQSLKEAHIAICRTPFWSIAETGTTQAMQHAELVLKASTAECTELALPDDFGHLRHWHATIMTGEGKVSFLSHYLKDPSLLHPQIRGYVEGEQHVTHRELRDAYDGCARLRSVWDLLTEKYDAVVVPSVPDEAPHGLEHTGDMVRPGSSSVYLC